MLGYATDAESLRLSRTHTGFLATGDLAWRDADGYYFIVGRLKRFIKIFGVRVGLDEVETQLQAAGYDVVVTGEDDVLMIATMGYCDHSELKEYITHRYKLHVSAIKLFEVSNVPQSSSGKILYADLLSSLKKLGS